MQDHAAGCEASSAVSSGSYFGMLTGDHFPSALPRMLHISEKDQWSVEIYT